MINGLVAASKLTLAPPACSSATKIRKKKGKERKGKERKGKERKGEKSVREGGCTHHHSHGHVLALSHL